MTKKHEKYCEKRNENTQSFSKNLKNIQLEFPTKKVTLKNIKNYVNIGSENFISEESRKFLLKFNVPMNFLHKLFCSYLNDETYKAGSEIVQNVKI
jgi:superoxide dismutase